MSLPSASAASLQASRMATLMSSVVFILTSLKEVIQLQPITTHGCLHMPRPLLQTYCQTMGELSVNHVTEMQFQTVRFHLSFTKVNPSIKEASRDFAQFVRIDIGKIKPRSENDPNHPEGSIRGSRKRMVNVHDTDETLPSLGFRVFKDINSVRAILGLFCHDFPRMIHMRRVVVAEFTGVGRKLRCPFLLQSGKQPVL